MTRSTPVKDQSGRLIAEREAALYDPDSRFRDHATELAAARPDAPAPADAPDAPAASSIYAKGERRRAGVGLTREMIRRIADRAEEAAAKRRGE